MDIPIYKQLKNISKEEAKKDYIKLQKIDLNKINLNSRIGNKFVDYYTFEERLNTKSKTGLTFYDVYNDKTNLLTKKYINSYIAFYEKKHKKKIGVNGWYDLFRLYFGTISLFKPITAMYIYNKYKPTNILDPTCGWGGRLVGATILNIKSYIGIDMNFHLEEPYKKMIDDIETDTNIKIYFENAVNFDYSKLTYDMVFTSPPYYNKELYRQTDKLTKEEWINTFYRPLFIQTFKYLQLNGYYILNIPRTIYNNICIDILGEATEKIPFTMTERHQKDDYDENFYIWKKIKPLEEN